MNLFFTICVISSSTNMVYWRPLENNFFLLWVKRGMFVVTVFIAEGFLYLLYVNLEK